jgi:hypothetical protein
MKTKTRKATKLKQEILKREEHFKTMTDDEVKRELDSGGFPEPLIAAYIDKRRHDVSSRIVT